jgi:hypothetical protein
MLLGLCHGGEVSLVDQEWRLIQPKPRPAPQQLRRTLSMVTARPSLSKEAAPLTRMRRASSTVANKEPAGATNSVVAHLASGPSMQDGASFGAGPPRSAAGTAPNPRGPYVLPLIFLSRVILSFASFFHSPSFLFRCGEHCFVLIVTLVCVLLCMSTRPLIKRRPTHPRTHTHP